MEPGTKTELTDPCRVGLKAKPPSAHKKERSIATYREAKCETKRNQKLKLEETEEKRRRKRRSDREKTKCRHYGAETSGGSRSSWRHFKELKDQGKGNITYPPSFRTSFSMFAHSVFLNVCV